MPSATSPRRLPATGAADLVTHLSPLSSPPVLPSLRETPPQKRTIQTQMYDGTATDRRPYIVSIEPSEVSCRLSLFVISFGFLAFLISYSPRIFRSHREVVREISIRGRCRLPGYLCQRLASRRDHTGPFLPTSGRTSSRPVNTYPAGGDKFESRPCSPALAGNGKISWSPVHKPTSETFQIAKKESASVFKIKLFSN